MGNWVFSINKEVAKSNTICNQQSEVRMTKIVTKVITEHLPSPDIQWPHLLEDYKKVNNSNKTAIKFIQLNHTTAFFKARSNKPLTSVLPYTQA